MFAAERAPRRRTRGRVAWPRPSCLSESPWQCALLRRDDVTPDEASSCTPRAAQACCPVERTFLCSNCEREPRSGAQPKGNGAAGEVRRRARPGLADTEAPRLPTSRTQPPPAVCAALGRLGCSHEGPAPATAVRLGYLPASLGPRGAARGEANQSCQGRSRPKKGRRREPSALNLPWRLGKPANHHWSVVASAQVGGGGQNGALPADTVALVRALPCQHPRARSEGERSIYT